jgi:hypothetical protein
VRQIAARRWWILVGIGMCVLLTAGDCQVDQAAVARLDLALHHAPVIFQDTDSSLAHGDYLTRFEYDNNEIADDNWDSFQAHSDALSAFVYYSVVETQAHWYIAYGFFHPLDWSDGDDSEHENDMEGMLAVVRRDGSDFGVLEGIITVFHLDFFTYTPTGTGGAQEDVDGELTFQSVDGVEHPVLSIEAEGHGVKAFPFAGNFSGADGEDGIVYHPARSATAEDATPSSGDDRNVTYTLLDFVPSLWSLQIGQARKSRSDSETFASFGTLKGDRSGFCGLFPPPPISRGCSTDSAHLPWAWDDEDDPNVFAGELGLDPAHAAHLYLASVGVEDQYSRNPYLSDLGAAGFGSGDEPRGWADQLDLGQLLDKAPAGT